MAGDLLLDTSAVIELFNEAPAAEQAFATAPSVAVSAVTLGELLYGAERSSRRGENIAEIEEFAAAIEILSCDESTASHYGEIKHLLRSKGRPLPDNDIWIAAVARQHGLTLLTRDGHFREVAGLSLQYL